MTESNVRSEGEEIRHRLFANSVAPEDYPADQYHAHLLEQYQMYAEMADRVSQRRGMANTFFATLNTAFLSTMATIGDIHKAENWVLPVIGLLLSSTWVVLLRSYRNLNTAKYKVVGALEEKLPSSPYWHAEWYALGEGQDWRKYQKLTVVETVVPCVFGVLYLIMLGLWLFGLGAGDAPQAGSS